MRGENDKELAKIKAKAELKMQQLRLQAELVQKKMEVEQKKMELEQRKMDNDFWLQMARMGHPQMDPAEAGSSSIAHSNTAASGSGYSEVGSVTPSSHSNDALQFDPDLEFYSTYDLNQQ